MAKELETLVSGCGFVGNAFVTIGKTLKLLGHPFLHLLSKEARLFSI